MIMEKVGREFGHHDLHDPFAVARTGNAASFRVGIAPATDQRGIAHTARKFAAGSPCRCRSDETAVAIERHGADGTRFMPQVMFGGVGIFAAAHPGSTLALMDQALRRAERDTVL